MAQSTLAVFYHPDFPQVFDAALDQYIRRILAKPVLSTCDYQSAESSYGAGDSEPCYAAATVHVLDSDQEFCARHFSEVSHG
jgi:hypothetical protein